jgi:hypothetical protein
MIFDMHVVSDGITPSMILKLSDAEPFDLFFISDQAQPSFRPSIKNLIEQ